MKTAIGTIALAAAVATMTGCWWGGAPCDSEMGYPRGEMPDLDMLVGETVETPLADHFTRPDCIRDSHNESRYWEARSSDPVAVAVSISADGQTLTTAAVSVADSVRVIVHTTLVDPEVPELYHEFLVRVRPHPTGH